LAGILSPVDEAGGNDTIVASDDSRKHVKLTWVRADDAGRTVDHAGILLNDFVHPRIVRQEICVRQGAAVAEILVDDVKLCVRPLADGELR